MKPHPQGRPVTDAWALVTGAGTGIGRAVSLALAQRGMHVVACGRRAEPLDVLATAAADLPGHVYPVNADAAVGGVLDDVMARHLGPDARLEVIVASAGSFIRGPVDTLPSDAWDAQVASNLTTAFHTLALASRRMATQELVDGRRGHVFTLNSGAGVTPFPGGAAYAAAKHGLRGLVESVRGELAGTRVKLTDVVVNACVESEMSAGRDVEKLPADVVARTVTACLELPAEANWDRIDLGQLA